ncbi:type I-F CRISPR-associated protein Csy2 [Pseudomonas panipatensis]|uniref:type I-F CRISPR-associated protein Csy2 n=1 Tax=Pseudomonas panipatensis TaxID=428992 RepID=UPI0035B46FDD
MTAADPEALLLLPRLRVQNANAISSPLTWGFPAPSAFTGFVHALQRRLASDIELRLDGVGIVCHRFDAQVSQPAGKRTNAFNLTRNPLNPDGSTAAIVEEGRAHLEISLLVGVSGNALDDRTPDFLARHLWQLAHDMRLAGGSLLPPTIPLSGYRAPALHLLSGSDAEQRALHRRLARRLLPGFALVSREALLVQHLQALRQSDANASELDALLDLARLNLEPPSHAENELPGAWRVRRKPGWLVPIPAGYGALSPLYAPGEVLNARDRDVPLRFVETLFSLGEWRSPHRVADLRQLLWYHQADAEAGLYRCTTPYFANDVDA